MTLHGAYVGQVLPGNEDSLHALESAIGHDLPLTTTFINNTSWGAFDSSVGWGLSQWPDHEQHVFSIPLTVDGTSLSSVANGEQNGHFKAAAEQIAHYDPNAIVRIGWEMNSDFFPWGNNSSDYVAAYKDAVDVFRAASGGFKFTWGPTVGADASKYYPGNDYVDAIGLDVYIDRRWTVDSEKAWSDLVNESGGLKWQADFAGSHGKPIAFPEWATDLDDGGALINHMADWIHNHNTAYEAYWNSSDNFPDGELSHHAGNIEAFGHVVDDYWHG
jgi:beta-mannanase